MCGFGCFWGVPGVINAQTRTSRALHPIKRKGSSALSPPPGRKTDTLYHYCIIFAHRFRCVSSHTVASCSLFFKIAVDAYKIWGIRESNLVTKSLRKISVHKIAIINASHYGMARVSRGGNKTYKNDFLGVKTGCQPHISHEYRWRLRSREIGPVPLDFGLFERKLAKNSQKTPKNVENRRKTHKKVGKLPWSGSNPRLCSKQDNSDQKTTSDPLRGHHSTAFASK